LKNRWRIIQSPPALAAFNMALDEALLLHVAEKTELPTLRLYAWETPTLSLGFSQKCEDVDFARLDQNGWQWVRRPTGGKAILHADELTYSITAPFDEPLVNGSLLESYQRISLGLQKTLALLGIETDAAKEYPILAGQTRMNPVCFQTPSNFEITWNNKKIIGSAQSRKSHGVLQHGSLPLFGDLTRITTVLKYADEDERRAGAQRLLERASTLETATGRKRSWEEVAHALETAFSQQYSIEFISGVPSENELAMAAELVQEKYGNSHWNCRL